MTLRTIKIGMSLAILLVLVMPFSVNSAAQTGQPIGSEWVYDYTDETIGFTFSGIWTYSCERITSASLGGADWEVVEYKSVLWATASISPYVSGDVEGELSEIGTEYYEVETNHLVGYVYNSAMRLNATVSGPGSFAMDSAERNETYYMPPGGTGSDPSTVFPGDTWQKSYTKHSNTTGHRGDEYYSEESTFNMTVSYEFVDYETVSVPAGTFSCMHVRMTASDGNAEDAWYSSAISNYVKITDEVGQAEIITYELNSYVLAHEQTEPAEMPSNLFLAIFFIFIIGTAAAAIYASMDSKGKQPPEFQALRSETSEKDIYRP